MLSQGKRKTPHELESYVSGLLHAADAQGAGKLHVNLIGQKIREADFGLTRMQLHAVLASATADDDGMVDIDGYVPTAADLIYRLLEPGSEMARQHALEACQERGYTG